MEHFEIKSRNLKGKTKERTIMDEAKELKQAYDIFTAAWRIYKAHYPPKDLKDDSYWSDREYRIEK